ncbi:MAG: flagellar basal body P-ring formation chaperone FlgA [Gammaproteobacteria bacterium]
MNTLRVRQLASAGLAILCLLGGTPLAQAMEPAAQIRQAVHAYALDKLSADEVKLGHLDSRLRLSRCAAPLQVSLPRGAQRVGQSTLEVLCGDAPGWKIYLPVHITRYAHVVVSQQSLPRGTVIGTEDVRLQKQDLSQLNYGYFKSTDEVIGMQLKRHVQRGESLSPGNLKPRRMVQRGDIVTILAEVDGLTVRVKGHALTDGYRGEAIRVKNQRSKRILQAEVIAPGVVQVRL